MLSKCANPGCTNTFRYLREGKLFLIEPASARIKRESSGPLQGTGSPRAIDYIWLCSACCRDLTVFIDREDNVRIVRNSDHSCGLSSRHSGTAAHIHLSPERDFSRQSRDVTKTNRQAERDPIEEQARLAERELCSFISAVTRLCGPEQARLSAQDWLEELESTGRLSVFTDHHFRIVTIAASARLAYRLNTALNQ